MYDYVHMVSITGSRGNLPGVRVSLKAEYMDGSMDEPMSETVVNTARRRMTFVVKTRDLGGAVPRIGDIVTTEDGVRFAVLSVQPFYNREYILDCRSC